MSKPARSASTLITLYRLATAKPITALLAAAVLFALAKPVLILAATIAPYLAITCLGAIALIATMRFIKTKTSS